MRIQFDLDAEGLQLLEDLKAVTGLKTYKDLFNNAITLLDWAINQRRAGRTIASMDKGNENYKELQMPAIERAAPRVTTPVESPAAER